MKGVGFSPSVPVKANAGVRARVPAAGKVLEGDDQQIYVHYITTMENVNFMTHRLTHIQRQRDVICDDLQQISKLFGTSVRAVRTACRTGRAYGPYVCLVCTRLKGQRGRLRVNGRLDLRVNISETVRDTSKVTIND